VFTLRGWEQASILAVSQSVCDPAGERACWLAATGPYLLGCDINMRWARMYSRTISRLPNSPRLLVKGSLAAAHECLGNNCQLNTTDHSAHTTIWTQINTHTHTHTTPNNSWTPWMSHSGSCASYSSEIRLNGQIRNYTG